MCCNSPGITFTSRRYLRFSFPTRTKSISVSFPNCNCKWLSFYPSSCTTCLLRTTLCDHRNLVTFFLQHFFSLFHTLHVGYTFKSFRTFPNMTIEIFQSQHQFTCVSHTPLTRHSLIKPLLLSIWLSSLWCIRIYYFHHLFSKHESMGHDSVTPSSDLYYVLAQFFFYQHTHTSTLIIISTPPWCLKTPLTEREVLRVRFPVRSNQTQCRQRLATAATFLCSRK